MTIETIKARREVLAQQHDQLVTQLQQVGTALERVRGAIALCDELLAAQDGAGPEPPDDEQKADTYA
jgi:hypothetical protein